MDVDRTAVIVPSLDGIGIGIVVVIVVYSPRARGVTSTHARVSCANVRVALRRISRGTARRGLTTRGVTVPSAREIIPSRAGCAFDSQRRATDSGRDDVDSKKGEGGRAKGVARGDRGHGAIIFVDTDSRVRGGRF